MEAAASGLKKYGFKRAIEFIEKCINVVAFAFSVLPEAWWKVDNEIKRVKLAVEMAERCGNRVWLASEHGLSPIETIAFINEFTGASLWLPHFAHVEDTNQAYSMIFRLLDEAFWRKAERQICRRCRCLFC